jgi:ABC-type amino acid transport substrate-binding protein
MRLVFLAAVLTAALSAQAQSALRLASDVWLPFTNETGKHAVAIALVHEALQRSGFQPETDILEAGAVTPAILSEEYDGSVAVWRDAAREESLRFSEPYLENRLVLVGRKGSDVQASSLAELQGKRIAIVESYAYGEAVDTARGITWLRGKDNQESLERLLREEADYMLVDELLMQYVLQHQPEEAKQYLEIGSSPLLRRSLHFALRKDRPGAGYILERFNRAIRAMIQDGTYHQILAFNWIRTDVDGDGQVELVLDGKRAGTQAPSGSYTLLASAPAAQGPERYFIEGKTYTGWDQVPEEYKVAPAPYVNPDGVTLLRFRF